MVPLSHTSDAAARMRHAGGASTGFQPGNITENLFCSRTDYLTALAAAEAIRRERPRLEADSTEESFY